MMQISHKNRMFWWKINKLINEGTHFESVDNLSGNCCFTVVGTFGEFVALTKLAVVDGLIAVR
jgi:hypothetical protein